MKFHVGRAEPLDIDLARPIDRDFDDSAIVKKSLQRSERSMEKVVPVVGDKLREGRVHDGYLSMPR